MESKNMKRMERALSERCKKEIGQCSYEELYTALLGIAEEESKKRIIPVKGRKLYYISAEFLIGKLLSNNLINLGIYDEVAEMLAQYGKDINLIEQVEPEPSLGNGGLGRLAACFLDSMATLGMNGDGIGLNYHFGLFLQTFENRLQKENKNPWMEAESWLTKIGRASCRERVF